MENKLFVSKFKLWEHFNQEVEGLDFNTTLRLPMFWFILDDGTEYRNGSVKEFAQSMNRVFSTNINEEFSYRYGSKCVLFFDEESKEEITEADGTMISLDEPVDENEEVTVSEAEEEPSITEPDWDWVESLSSTKEDKLALDQYAEDNFDIKLKRNATLENMIKAFKEAYEIKITE